MSSNYLCGNRSHPISLLYTVLISSATALVIISGTTRVFAQDALKQDAARDTAVPVRVFVLAGQSNMEGQGVVDLDHPKHYNGGKGTLKHVIAHAKDPKRYAHVRDSEGNWRTRDDVWVRFRTKSERKLGPLGIGFAGYPGKHHIGPEFQFGHVTGDAFKSPVLLVKTAWGGKSLFKDFRPPSLEGETGPYYEKMLIEVQEALDQFETEFPQFKERPRVLSGFVWQQGWNDMYDERARSEYADNLTALIRDVRKEWKAPKLPVVIGELGNMGPKASPNMQAIRDAQRSVAKREEFQDTVRFVPTAAFARPKEVSPNVSHGHHWFGNAESYFLIGDALGHAMVELVHPKSPQTHQASGTSRAAMLLRYGGSEMSETAVASALDWIVRHQLPDGGWNFRHDSHPRCNGACSRPGNLASARNAATSMALLPLLSAGHTHKEGEHRRSVQRGIAFLLKNAKPTGSFHESGGTMYSHGLAAWALCDAYRRSSDPALRLPAQKAVDFIVLSQDPKGGGWRYSPRSPGDTSVTGWQLQALRTARKAKLNVPVATTERAASFLSSVAVEDGAFYGYTTPGRRVTTSAIGLLQRLHELGHIDDVGLEKGLNAIAKIGPSKVDAYFNFHATELFFHAQGKNWAKWNNSLRDQLLSSQEANGHAKGSWEPSAADLGSGRGGRLYATSLHSLILQSYYRMGEPVVDR